VANREALYRFVRARGFPPSLVDDYRSTYPKASDGELISAIMTEEFYRIPTLEVARAHSGTHVYEFAWRSPAYGGAIGACHALKLPFVFDNLDDRGYATPLGASPPRELAESMRRAWSAFAATGDPGWPPYAEPAGSWDASARPPTDGVAEPAHPWPPAIPRDIVRVLFGLP
jgi:para-nitrobenzyl esterase